MTLRAGALRVVPEDSRWVERLADALRRAGAPARSVSLCDGLLRIELPSGDLFVFWLHKITFMLFVFYVLITYSLYNHE